MGGARGGAAWDWSRAAPGAQWRCARQASRTASVARCVAVSSAPRPTRHHTVIPTYYLLDLIWSLSCKYLLLIICTNTRVKLLACYFYVTKIVTDLPLSVHSVVVFVYLCCRLGTLEYSLCLRHIRQVGYLNTSTPVACHLL